MIRRANRGPVDALFFQLVTPSAPGKLMSHFMRCFTTSCLPVSAYRFNQAEHLSGEHNGPDQCYYIPEFEAVLDCYLEMKSQGSATLDKYVEERKAYVTEMIEVSPTPASYMCLHVLIRTVLLILKHVFAVNQWQKNMRMHKHEQDSAVRAKRETRLVSFICVYGCLCSTC